jgi:transcriptional regulator with XRE-family HTH domain
LLNFALARRRRRWLDLTQEEVARRMGVAKQAISYWENGVREPTLENAVAWAKALDLDLADLLAEPEPEPAEQAS